MKTEKATRQTILEIAVDHFSRLGYAGTNLEQIGQEAGLTRGPLYYYFKNKKELYLAAARFQMEEDIKEYRRIFSQESSIFDRLREDMIFCTSHHNMIVQIGSGGKEEPAVQEAERFSRELYDLKREALKKAQEEGELLPDADLDEMTGLIYIYYYGTQNFNLQNERYQIISNNPYENCADRFAELFWARYGNPDFQQKKEK